MNAAQRRLAALLVVPVLLASCAEVPITGRKQLLLINAGEMQAMSFKSYGEFLAKQKLSANAEQTQMVKGCGSRIRQAVESYFGSRGQAGPLAGYEWEFSLIESKEVNAWCMPGGKVVVYTGMLAVAQNETGLAVVIGHEIAHAVAQHGNERMSHGMLVALGSSALETATKEQPEETRGLFLAAFGVGATVGFILPYSRTHENEADRLGLIFMAMAGYDPHAAVGFWERMAKLKKGAGAPEFLSTHPSDATRIANIRRLVREEAMQHYRPRTTR